MTARSGPPAPELELERGVRGLARGAVDDAASRFTAEQIERQRFVQMVDVLLAATRRENVDARQAVLEIGGLTAKVVDIEAYALENACRLLTYQMPDEGLDKTIGVVDFGATTTTFSVLRDRKIIYTRDQAFGGKQLTEEIMRHYGLSFEEAGKAKREGGLPSNYKPEILDPFLEDMAQQVNRSIQFFLSSQSEFTDLDQIIICGGCSAIPAAAARGAVPRARGVG